MGFIEIIDEQETFDLAFGDSVLTVRRVSAEKYEAIAKKRTRRYRTRQGEWMEEKNDFAVMRDVVAWAVLDWRGVRHPVTKEDVPCDEENKMKLPPRVMEDILDAITEAREIRAEKDKGELGNLSGSSA